MGTVCTVSCVPVHVHRGFSKQSGKCCIHFNRNSAFCPAGGGRLFLRVAFLQKDDKLVHMCAYYLCYQQQNKTDLGLGAFQMIALIA